MKLKSYPRYKETGLKWLGQVPASWGIVPLWTLYSRGKTTDFPDEELLSVYRDHGVVPKSSRDDNFNKPSEDLSAYQLVKPGDMVINKMKAWQGSVAISRHRGIVSPAYFVYERHHGMDDRYLHYLLRSERFITGYLSLSKGIRINQWDLDPTYHSRMPVLVPSLQEQQDIVGLLDSETAQIDELIGKQERLIELLAEKRQGMITHAVTKGLEPAAPTKPSGIPRLGDIPATWSTVRFSRILQGIKDGTHGTHARVEAGMPLLGSTNVRTGHLARYDNESQISHQEHLSIVANGYPRRGDVLLAIIGASIGRSCVYDMDQPLAFQRSVAFLRFTEATDPNFMQLFMESDFYQQQLWNNVKSSAQGGVYLGVLSSLTALLPPAEEQRVIAASLTKKLSRIARTISKVEESIQLLNERRSALISAAVTGKVDVREQVAKL